MQNYGRATYHKAECGYESVWAQRRGAGELIYANPDDHNSFIGGFADIC